MRDREYLRQSAVRRSNVFTANSSTTRSFINTAIVNDSYAYGDDLRKSRIQNLPNYKKSNLGESINFVVVFQTIEIERLSNEVEVLRVRLKQAERQLFNASNYEIQIKQLTQKLYTCDNQLEEYKEQYEKLNKICQTLYHENQSLKNQLSQIDFSLKQKYESERQKNQDLLSQIQKWKTRYQAAEKSKAKELEELRNMMESQRKSMIDREIKEMAIRFQNERGSLEGQIRKLREMLNNREGEIDNYKQKCQRYQIQNMELRNNEQLILQYENKLALISNELNRLSEMARNKDDQIQNYKKREYDLNLKLKEQGEWENDNRLLREHLDAKTRQIEDWRTRASRLEEEAIRGKQMLHFKNELQDKLDLAAKELDRLNGLLRGKIDEIQKWKQRVSSTEAQLAQFRNLQNDVAQYENKLNMSKAENDRINGILKSRQEEIQSWKRKNNELQEALSKMGLVEKDRKMFEDKFNNQIKNIEELNFVINQLQNDNDNLRRMEDRCREFEGRCQAMAKENERLNGIIRGKQQEVNDSRVKLNKMEGSINEFKNIQIQFKDQENKIALMTQEIDRLNNLIKDKNEDISTLEHEKIQLHQAINQYKNYQLKMQENEQTINKLQSALSNARNELDQANNKFRSSEAKTKQIENNLYSQSQDKERANAIARQKTQECQDLKNRLNNSQNELRRMAELQGICQQLKNQQAAALNDLESADRKIRQMESLLGREKNANQELKNKLNSTVQEHERLRNEARNNEGKISREYSELQEHYSRLQSKVKQKDSETDLLVSKITQLQAQCSQLMQEFNRLLDAVEQSYKETAELSQRIEEYQDYASRIHILGKELDRLVQLNKGLEEDNKTMRLKYASNINFEKKEQEFQLMSVLLAVECESLRARIDQRQVSMEQMRRSYLQPLRKV